MATTPIQFRNGDRLRIGREHVAYGRNIIATVGSTTELQRRLFVNDPWELIAEAIARAVPKGRRRDIAHSFRRQAEDYFRVATAGRELAVRPVLLYYAFLNLSKAYGLVKGNNRLASRVTHGIHCNPTSGTIVGAPIKFSPIGSNQVGVFQELLSLLGGNPAVLNQDMSLGHLMPQVLPGHRLWCYASGKHERFFSTAQIRLINDATAKELSIILDFIAEDFERLPLSRQQIISYAGFNDFDVIGDGQNVAYVHFQQRQPVSYTSDPATALTAIIASVRNRIWETVRLGSPYRKSYVYLCPPAEQASRLPQLLSIYLLMFFLGSVTRYNPQYFEDLIDSKYGSFFSTFISESPLQFLYLMASEILGREVSKPAII